MQVVNSDVLLDSYILILHVVCLILNGLKYKVVI